MRRSLRSTLSQAALLGGALALGACNKAPPPPPPAPAAPEPPKAEAPKAEAPKAPEAEAPKAEAPKPKPAPKDEATGLGVVLASKLNVRSEPHVAKKNIHGALHCGDVVQLDGAAGDRSEWYKVKVEKIEGYAHGAFIVPLRPGARRPLCEIARGKKFDEASPEAQGKDDPVIIATAGRQTVIPPKETKQLPAAPEPVLAPVDSTTAQATPTPPPVEVKPAPALAPVKPAAPEQVAQKPTPTPPTPATPPTPPPASKAAEKDPPDKIALSKQPPSGAKQVAFTHDVHMNQIACFKCHHPVSRDGGALKRLVGDGDPNDEKLCHSCHKRDAAAGVVRIPARKAFHGNCIDCHRTSGNPKAPFQCSGCHKPL